MKDMKDVKNFLLNLSNEDIDIVNKLDNMYGSEITDEELYKKLSKNKYIQKKICNNIRCLIEEDLDYVAEYVLEETKYLYEDELIDLEDDYTAGLYNMDELYISAIEMTLDDLHMSDEDKEMLGVFLFILFVLVTAGLLRSC